VCLGFSSTNSSPSEVGYFSGFPAISLDIISRLVLNQRIHGV